MFGNFLGSVVGLATIGVNAYSDIATRRLAIELQQNQTAAVQAQTVAANAQMNRNIILYSVLALGAFVIWKKVK